MEEKYSDFGKKNPTLQDRIEAFTSGLLTPDTKAITLLAMAPGELYSHNPLYKRVVEFSGGYFPVKDTSAWWYVYAGPSHTNGTLTNFGFTESDYVTLKTVVGEKQAIAYRKTSAGQDLGDAVVALAIRASRMLDSKYKSMWKIFGSARKHIDSNTRRGYKIYQVIKLLAQNLTKVYTETDLEDMTGYQRSTLSYILNGLGFAGIIDYQSPSRFINGKLTRGWAISRLVNKDILRRELAQSVDEIYQFKSEELRKTSRQHVLDTLGYIITNPDSEFEFNSMAKNLKVSPYEVSMILGVFKNLGYLKSDFGITKSKARANHNSMVMWLELMEPMEEIAKNLNPSCHKKSYEATQQLRDIDNSGAKEIQRFLSIYDVERTSRGMEGSREIDRVLLSLSREEIISVIEIKEFTNQRLQSPMTTSTVSRHLNKLEESHYFEKISRGRYRRIN